MASSGPRRIFSYAEARRLLPIVRERTKEALERLSAIPSPPAAQRDEDGYGEEVRQAAAQVLAEWAAGMEKLGCEVKGPWLVDFDSGAGYYCWKWPEESLEFFHGYEEGFAGRVRLQ